MFDLTDILVEMLSNSKSRLELYRVDSQLEDYLLCGDKATVNAATYNRVRTEMKNLRTCCGKLLCNNFIVRALTDNSLEVAFLQEEPSIPVLTSEVVDTVKQNISNSNLDAFSKITCMSMLECCGVYSSS